MRTKWFGLSVLVCLGVVAAASASPIGVYVNDDFTTATVDPAEWTYSGSGSVTGGQVDGSTVIVKGGSDGGEEVLRSIDQVSPGAGQAVVAKGMGLNQSSVWSYLYFGIAGENDAIVVHQWTADGDGWTKLLIKKDGVEQTKYLGNKWYSLAGDNEFAWTSDRITWSLNGEVRFDTATDGGTWNIPTAPMGLLSAAGFNTNELSFGSQRLEVTPEPTTMLLLAAGALGVIRRKR